MKTSCILFFSIFLLFLNSCENKSKKDTLTLSGFVFGTTYKIIYPSENQDYTRSIDSLFIKINRSLSTYSSSSDISKINKGDTTVVVDAFFKEVFAKSKSIYKNTNGYFDPTVGNLVNAWGFGPKKELKDLSDDDIKAHMNLVGFHKVHLDSNLVIKTDNSIYLDFNSIAKGYGVDVIGRFLETKNIQNYLVEIGGEIRTKGKKINGKPWRIGIDNPNTDGSRSVSKYLNISNKSMATSGNYRKFRISKEGVKYVHTINPKTGYATESNLLSASVIASLDCADVDAYATAFMAMGLEKTKEFLVDNKHISAILIYTDKEGSLKEFVSETVTLDDK